MDILTFPNPLLREKANEWDLSNKKQKEIIEKLVSDMSKTMYNSNGIGLAAPQVGVSKRLFIIDIEQKVEKDDNDEIIARHPGKLHVFINPKITKEEGSVIYEEGCLSVPGIYEEVKRAEKITVEYYDLDFKKQELTAEEFMAVVIQHENDHLDGKLFIDKLPMVKRTMVKNRILKGKNL
jgi:peptide deformylase